MRNGYRQNTYGWRKFLSTSPRLSQIQFQIGNRIAGHYRRLQRRGANNRRGAHTANQIRVTMAKAPGGRRGDRMETMVIAYGKGATFEEFRRTQKQGSLKRSLVVVSGGRTISRKGRVT